MATLPRQGQRLLAGMVMLTLSGCAYIPHKPLVDGSTSAQPAPPTAPVPNGSIFQAAQPMNYGYQPLFEDRRPRNVGDTLTIVLQENVSASKSSSANASRNGSSKFGVATAPRYLDGLLGNARADMDISGDNSFGGKGGANANNTFNGTITVTVNQVLSNGNLHVVGKNRSPLTRAPSSSASPGWLTRAPSAVATRLPQRRWRTRASSMSATATSMKRRRWAGCSGSSSTSPRTNERAICAVTEKRFTWLKNSSLRY